MVLNKYRVNDDVSVPDVAQELLNGCAIVITGQTAVDPELLAKQR
jgi:hypothetical protein